MKLSKKQTTSKDRLNTLCTLMGFQGLIALLKLSGSSLGQYLSYDCTVTISETKLELAETQYKLRALQKQPQAI